MRRPDPRRERTQRLILGLLANSYGLKSLTTLQIAKTLQSKPSTEIGKRGLGLRNLKRYLYDFSDRGWIEQESSPNLARFRITVEGYLHFHAIFEGRDTSSLNAVPHQLMPPLMSKKVWRLTDDQARYFAEYSNNRGSLLVLLPTGAGKTLIALMEAYRHYLMTSGHSKTLYISPFKAINSQSLGEFRNVLGPLGISSVRQDGDYHTNEGELREATIVVSTFESAQIALQRGDPWLNDVGLVIIDELTSIDSTSEQASEFARRKVATERGNGNQSKVSKPPRGANLDLLVVCLRDLFDRMGKGTRFVCLGIPNASQTELQMWLGNDTAILNPTQTTQRYEERIAVFGSSPDLNLTGYHLGLKDSSTRERTEPLHLNWQLERKDGSVWDGPFPYVSSSRRPILAVVLHYLERFSKFADEQRRPILVFVHGRKSASSLATWLRDIISANIPLLSIMTKGREANRLRLLGSALIPTATVGQLADLVNHGIGFHHAGLFPAQRRLLEDMMNDRNLSVLFSTPTLTHGVDFPIGAVIVDNKLLNFFDYSRLEYVQLRGRVNHKDPFEKTAVMADVVAISGNAATADGTERVRDLLVASDPKLVSCSLAPGNLETLLFKSLQYLCSRSDGAKINDVLTFVQRTYEYGYLCRSTGRTNALNEELGERTYAIVKTCIRQQLIRLDGAILRLADHGKIANQVGLSFYDTASVVRALESLLVVPKNLRDQTLLSVSVSLVDSIDEVQEVLPRRFMYEDIPSRLRRSIRARSEDPQTLRANTVSAIMNRWMAEDPVDKVIMNTPRFQIFENGLLASARALSRILRAISRTAEILSSDQSPPQSEALREIASQAQSLSIRIRFGVREDIVRSELGPIAVKANIEDLVNSLGYPEFIIRMILRLMRDKGITNAHSIREYEGRKLVTLYDLRKYHADKVTASHVARYHRKKIDEVSRRIIAASSLDAPQQAIPSKTKLAI